MSVPASFGEVRCRTNSVGVKWRDDVGVFFWEGVGRRNNKVMGRDTARGPTRFGNWHEQSAQGAEGHLDN